MAGVFGEDLDPPIGSFALDGHSRFQRLYRDGKAHAVDMPEDLSWGTIDCEAAVVDSSGLVGDGRERGCGVIQWRELHGEIRGKRGDICWKVDCCVSGCGGDCCSPAVIDTRFRAFEACVDKVLGGVEGVVDDEGFTKIIVNFIAR